MLVTTTAAPRTRSEIRGGHAKAACVSTNDYSASWQALLSLLILAGSPITGAMKS